jgi:hypothetical protein
MAIDLDWTGRHARLPPPRGRARSGRGPQWLFYLSRLINLGAHSFRDFLDDGRMQFRTMRGMGRGMSDLESSQVDLRASVATVAWSHRLCDVLEARETEACSKGVLSVRHATLVRKIERRAGAMSSRRIDCRNERGRGRRKKEAAAATTRYSTSRWRDGGGIGDWRLILGAQKRSTRLGLLMMQYCTVDWTGGDGAGLQA